MTTDRVIIDIEGPIATVTFNDPDRRNPISHDVKEHLVDALPALVERPVRCVVFQGAGTAFSSGGDIDSMKERRKLGDEEFKAAQRKELKLANQLIHTVYTLELPTIASIDGAAVGSGAALALACDVRLASEHTKIGFTFRHVGLSVDSGVSYLLPRIVGLSKAKDLSLTGEIIDAPTAYDIGLVDRFYDEGSFESKSEEYISQIANGPTVALTQIKQLMNGSLNHDIHTALDMEKTAQEGIASTNDYIEGVDAFLNKETTDFSGT